MADPSEDLYEYCCKEANSCPEGYKKIFKQEDLLRYCQDADSKALNDVKDVEKLMPLVARMSKQFLIITLKTGSGSQWTVRPRKVANEVRQLGKDERMVFEVVEGAQEEGVWIRMIKNRTGIKDGHSLDKLVAKLQRQKLIKSVKNVKAMNQKTYILSHLAPSETITGGSFYDAGVLDETLVEEVGNIIIFHVRMVSWFDPPREKVKRPKRVASPIEILDDDQEGASRPTKKRKTGTGAAVKSNDIEDMGATSRERERLRRKARSQLAYTRGHEYPTASSIHKFIISANVLRAAKSASLTVDEVQKVINILVWDEKLEPISGGYRTARGVKYKEPGVEEDEAVTAESKRGNGLTEAPCGRCPVIDICGNGGPVNAGNCPYFTEWLVGKPTATATSASATA
ncbi:34-kDa subunit of RNA polymerase III (C) [Saxophila tyrrhenica]|uniref:DNA-directed RNA polymerase III subunit RPC6 n=1 Tax=Saxophila tyrrhenica TaxID=1690608 RepID=A0AAV9NVT5_9PEZI|nr:34-kDa subunit of RNA polymerase III (C) [Saxophila tyrrhenica]